MKPESHWNKQPLPRDYYGVECSVAREALSARVDGEREPVPAARLDEHLAGCAPCRQWYAAAVEQTQTLRRLAGRSQVTAVPAPRNPPRRLSGVSWQRWALGAIGLIQVGLALAQGLGAHLGLHHAPAAGHLLNESTAWSGALGLVMIAAAIRPGAAAGLGWVLAAFTTILAGYLVGDAISGAVTLERALSHLPVAAGAVLALLVSRPSRPAGPSSDAAADAAELALPHRAARGRRRSHLHPTDGSAA